MVPAMRMLLVAAALAALLGLPSPAAAGTTSSTSPECPPRPAQLGFATWTFLHTMAAKYPDVPTPQQRDVMKTMMEGLVEFYPCQGCTENLRELFKASPPAVASNRDLNLWLCGIHNDVNALLGKPAFNCSRTTERWRDGPEDGSCGSRPPPLPPPVPPPLPPPRPPPSPPAPINVVSAGCFVDSRTNRIFLTKNWMFNANTVRRCAQRALRNGDTVFGVEYARECWFGAPSSSISSIVAGRVPSSNCNMVCPGNAAGDTTDCGGAWAIHVYKIVKAEA